MPSMTAGQLRDLERDFANYRRYTVEIREERINVEGQTATVTGQVVRSFETRDGEKSGHTVSTSVSPSPEWAELDHRAPRVALTLELRMRSRC